MLFANVGTRFKVPTRRGSTAALARHNPPRARNRTADGPVCTYVHQLAVTCTLVKRKKFSEKCRTNHTKLHIPSVLSAPVAQTFLSADSAGFPAHGQTTGKSR